MLKQQQEQQKLQDEAIASLASAFKSCKLDLEFEGHMDALVDQLQAVHLRMDAEPATKPLTTQPPPVEQQSKVQQTEAKTQQSTEREQQQKQSEPPVPLSKKRKPTEDPEEVSAAEARSRRKLASRRRTAYGHFLAAASGERRMPHAYIQLLCF